MHTGLDARQATTPQARIGGRQHRRHQDGEQLLRRVLALCWPTVGALWLAACAHPGAAPPLATPVSEQLPLRPGQTAAVQASWWQQLRDPLLNRLVRQTLAQAADVRAAAARLRAAEAEWRGERGRGGVQVSARLSGTALHLSPPPDAGREAQHDANLGQLSAQLQAAYTFDFWGKHKHSLQAALGRHQAAAWQLAQMRLHLAQTVVAQYTEWQRLNATQALLLRRIEAQQAQQQRLAQRIGAGLLPGSTAYAAEQTGWQLQAARLQGETELARLRHHLAVLSGQTPAALDHLQPPPLGATPQVAVAGLRADVLAQRPDIAAQRALLQSRRHQVAADRAAFYPNIEIRSFAGLSQVDAFDLLHNRARILGWLPALNLPLFNGGSLRAQLAGSRARHDEQVAQYDQTVLTALRQSADAIADYRHSAETLAGQQQAAALAERRAAAVRRRMAAGLGHGLDLWPDEDAALMAAIAEVEAAARHRHSWNNLNAALGGGFGAATPPQP